MPHTVSIFPPVLLQLSCICLFALFLERVYCAGPIVVSATDTRIQYNPPLDDVNGDGWSIFDDGNTNITLTNNADATAYFNFTGTSFTLNSIINDKKISAAVDITFDGNVSTAHGQGLPAGSNAIFSQLDLDPSIQHNVSMRMSQMQDGEKGNGAWNIMSIEYNPPSATTTLPSILPFSSSLTSTPSPAQASTPSRDSSLKESKSPPTGTIVGAAVGACLGIGVICILSICLHRHRRRSAELVPEPLVIITTTTSSSRRKRSQFRRIYSDYLPRFAAPTSIWPSSTAPTAAAPPLPTVHPPVAARDSHHGKITPFVLPEPAPIVLAPPPPKRTVRQRVHTSFFVMNPSSHSSHSEQSQPARHLRGTDAPDTAPKRLHTAKKAGRVSVSQIGLTSMDAALQGVRRQDKGKQRAIEFEIEPISSTRAASTKMRRGQSLRRFFFTTNPNPSTASGSSSSSSHRSKSGKRVAVEKYVRAQMQMQHKPRANMTSTLSSAPLVKPKETAARPSLDVLRPATPEPKRHSETVPSINTPEMDSISGPQKDPISNVQANPASDERSDYAESVLSEIPRPRLDKGKGRAF
ncbi:hypothetical protein M0805_001506 [Coniferiporia weirii]|nr:hypothetical protein M0805_001506 [Coniferiporia weirii]